MSIDDFGRYSNVLHGLTVDFVRAVPDDKGDFTPGPPRKAGRAPALHRIGQGFAPFCKQLRHVVCVRGVCVQRSIGDGKSRLEAEARSL
jgi:hypothetical protein